MSRFFRLAKTYVAAIATAAIAASMPAWAGEFDALAGKTLRFVISSAPNSNGDIVGRIFVEALKKKVPEMTVLAQNMPAGGGMAALAEVGTASGSAITLLAAQSGPIYGQMLGTAATVNFQQFQWIGALSGNRRLALVSKSLAGKSPEELKTLGRPLVSVTSAVGSASETETLLISALTGLNLKVVPGVEENQRIPLLMSGEADVVLGSYDPTVEGLITSGDVAPLFQIGGSVLPEKYADVPKLADVVPPDAPREIVGVMESLNKMGRLVAAAPSTEPAVVEALRSAFDQIVADPDVIKSYADKKVVVAPTSGVEAQSRIDGLLADKSVIELMRGYIECGKRISAGEVTSCKSS